METKTKIEINGSNKQPKAKKASPSARQSSAETIARILAFFNAVGAFAKRTNVIGVPIHGKGGVTGFRPSTMQGFPDILAVLPPFGRTCGVEVKTGRDRLRPEQEGIHHQLRKVGALVMVVKDFEDFEKQWQNLETKNK